MSQRCFETSALIDARPEEIYAILVDYHNGHPQIVPKEYFRNMEVEEGGYGAGTIIRYHTRVFGVERPARAVVSEPEPGRVLVETEMTSSIVTTFTITPISNGQQTRVQIATEWKPGRNIFAVLEQAFYPMIMRRMYPKELNLIAAFVKNRTTTEGSSQRP
jgi:hypothetical protein